MTHLPGTILLETTHPLAQGDRLLCFQNPIAQLKATHLDQVVPLLEEVDRAVNNGYFVAGFLSYEAGYAFVSVSPKPVLPETLAWFGVYTRPQRAFDATHEAPFYAGRPVFSWSRVPYTQQIEKIRTLIQEGDVYQINLTGQMQFDFEGDVFAFYKSLRQKQAVGYSAFLQTETETFLSLSPELFFEIDGQKITTRPMKGTTQRGRNVAEDLLQTQYLQNDEKSRAENLMIVDLLRNDLSQICEPASVLTQSLFDIETYRSLHQMTSTITGKLVENTPYSKIFKAMFPCGSVTGAPKQRAMQRIAALEPNPRGLYCGAIGYVSPNQKAVFSVAIRTITIQHDKGSLGVGSGVVWDSNASDEYDECLLKARFLTDSPTKPIELFETIRWDNGAPLLPYHVARMEKSAAYFQIPFQKQHFLEVIETFIATEKPQKPTRLRISLNEHGHFKYTAQPIAQQPQWQNPPKICISPVRTSASDPFYQHKTTQRSLYEAEYARAVKAGFFEVIFLNEDNLVTEGSRSTIFIRKNGHWLTPRCQSGALPGIYRQFVLAQPHTKASEADLTLEDLVQADEIRLCNAIWQWTPPVHCTFNDEPKTL